MHGLRHVLEQAQKNGVAVGRSSGRITQSMLKLAEANRAIVAAQVYARDHGYSISVTVCDSMGHLIAHQRMDDVLLGVSQ